MKRRGELVSLLFTWLLAGCGAPSPSDESAQLVRASVTGGAVAAHGAWPMVAWLDNGCTGVLIAEDLVAFAAHCGTQVSAIWLGDLLNVTVDARTQVARASDGPGVTKIPVASCVANPNWQLGASTDVAFCTLDAPALQATEIAPPLLGCANAFVTPGTTATLVGFGLSETDTAPGTKRVVQASVVSLGTNIQIGDAEHGTCAGDSGSPAFVRVGDGDASEWQVLGLLSSGLSGEACGAGFYTPMSNALVWIESASHRDLSPCFDAKGDWSPTAACVRPAIDANGAVTTAAVERDSLCGPAYDASQDASGCRLGGAPRRTGGSTLLFGACSLAWVLRKRRARGASS